MCKGGRSQTMVYSYGYTLCRRAVVATCDLSAANLHLLSLNHWLRDPANVLTLWLDAPAWEGATVQPQPPAADRMKSWTVHEVASFLQMKDLDGPAGHLSANGVTGEDLFSFDRRDLIDDLRCSPFAAKKVLAARDAFLQEA